MIVLRVVVEHTGALSEIIKKFRIM